MRKDKGSWSGGPAVPRYPGGDPRTDAAQHLRLVAGRYLNGRATEREVYDAIDMWREAVGEAALARASGLPSSAADHSAGTGKDRP